ncbi:MAG TPA: HAMP domain-containing histidine kinase [Bacteroidetes bacterium]|nr:HAMP domain-containing histidine kinase [Bacteroidota bacterium]
MARENPVVLFMAPQPSDTSWRQVSDPYRSPNNEWKQTMGVLNGRDTLWWYGDPAVNIHEGPVKKGEDPGYYVRAGMFDLRVLVNTEYPEISREISAGRTAVKKLFAILEIVIILLITVFTISIILTRQQASRNRIALAHLAHSIKTPVARIRLDTDSLLEEMVASPEEERDIIAAIGRECARMERAVQGAALSLEAGRRTLNLEICDLAEVVTAAVKAWAPQFKQAGVQLRLDTQDVALTGRFDRDMIAILIDNLIDNALRHTRLNLDNIKKGGAAVTVLLRKVKSGGAIIVDDMGGGIPVAERRRIFKQFQRVRGDAASGVSGLGLGLSMAKEIVEAHGGGIRVEGNDSGGTRFVVELPILHG